MSSSFSIFHGASMFVVLSISCFLTYVHKSSHKINMVKEALDAHNAARRAVGILPLTWKKPLGWLMPEHTRIRGKVTVVWNMTRHVGCSRIICKNGGTIITCEYSPPGNYVGGGPY
ncbi:hypothetical protein CRG98_026984 [Punica granatum]|uniref:SCP domain-containing protein n=1 Tax=Punica granatum TaxID=22663 RepID=A0A2I0J8R9_PUNGR|nr:hypothetical protein CRG98_026984 [Punica granatum]